MCRSRKIIAYPFEQTPLDEPDYSEYPPDPCPFCMEDPCECDIEEEEQ